MITASNAAAAGTMTRRTASSVNGTTTVLTNATTILAFVWLVAPRAHTNGVNRPYRVRLKNAQWRIFFNDCTKEECSPYVSTVSEISELGKLKESFLTVLMRVKRCNLNYLLYRFPIANKRSRKWMLFYAVIKLSPLPKNLSQREKIVFIQNDVFEPRRVLRVEP